MTGEMSQKYSHCVIAQEVGEQGTPHLQFNITFLQKMTFAQVRSLFPRAHLEKTKSLRAAERYCMKDAHKDHPERIFVCDNRVRAKQSVEESERLETFVERLRAGQSVQQIVDDDPVGAATSYKRLEWLATKICAKRTEKPHVTWCFGKTGTGKSTWCHEQAALVDPNYFIHGGDMKWWDGYDGQLAVVVEEFRGSDCKLSKLLRFLDRWPLQLEVKGGTTQMVATHVFINSCFKPSECYRSLAEDIRQLQRRIDVLYEFEIVAGAFCRSDRNNMVALIDPFEEDVPMEQQWYGPERM